MSEFNIEVEGGASVRLPTAGKYCDRDIVVTAEGGSDKMFVSYINGTLIAVTADDLCDVTQIAAYSFYSNGVITSIEMPDTVTSIGSNAFYSCGKLTRCKLSNAVKSIGVHAFSRCYALKWGDLILPDGLQTLENYAFWYNRGMTSVTIPASIVTINNEVFRYSNTLKTVTVLKETPPTLGTKVFDNTLLEAIFVPASSVEDYKAATNWSAYAEYIRGG